MKKTLLSSLLFLLAAVSFGQYKILQIGAKSVGSSEVRLKLVARIQGYNQTPTSPTDFYDSVIYSPKCVYFKRKSK